MQNHSGKEAWLNGFPIIEKLEKRELMSVSSPVANTLDMPQLSADASKIIVPAARAVQKVSAIPSVGGTGLTGEYFSDSNFKSGYLVRTDPSGTLISSNRDSAATRSDSIRWTGQISPTYSEMYSFLVKATGGIQLWVNGQLLIDQASSAGGYFRSPQTISLVAGQKYDIDLQYTRKSSANAKVQLIWSSLHQKQGVVRETALFPDTTVSLPATSAGLIGQYYKGKNFNTLVMERVDPGINFVFGSNTPSPLIPGGSPFSVRWTGQIVPAYTETYKFTTTSDDGVRLYVDDQLLIDNYVDHFSVGNSVQIPLVAGQAYDIRMDYYEDRGVATAQLRWSSPSQPTEIVPAAALSSTPAATAGTLTAVATSSSSIHLSWTGSTTSTGYLVEESADGGSTYTTVATTAANVLEYDIDGLNPSTMYTFRIAPVGSADTSVPSNTTAVGTETDSPAGTSASPTSATTATINWGNVPGNNGYVVYGAPAGNASPAALVAPTYVSADVTDLTGYNVLGTVGADITSFSVTGLLPGTQYQFVVRSLNAADVLSDPGSAATATTPTAAPDSAPVVLPSLNSIVITWPDVPGGTGYSIERSADGTSNWVQIGTTVAGVLTYIDDDVQPGATYYYRVRGINSGGTSDPSSATQAVTLVMAPANLTGNLTTAVGTVLSWADVAGEQGFVVLESVDGGNTFSQIGITPTGVTSFPVTNLTTSTPYQFEVEAVNAANSTSAASSVVSLTTLPIAPASLVATPLSTTSAQLVWTDVAGESGFLLQRSADGTTGWTTIATLPASTLTYTDTTLSPGTNYFYQVQAINGGGSSEASSSATALTIPAAPVASLTGLSVSQSQVSWAAVTGASQYVVQRSLDGLTAWTTAGTATGTLSAAVANLAPSTKYYYRVAAVNASGTSAQSTVVSQITAPLAQYALHNAIYGTTSSGAIYVTNVTNGTSTWIGQLPVIPAAPTRDPTTGMMYYYQQGTANIYSWDPNTGNSALVLVNFISSPITRGAYSANGTGYVISQDDNLRTINPTTLAVTVVGKVTLAGVALATTAGSMTFSSSGTLFMLIAANLYTLNTSTAAATLIGSITVTGNPVMVFGPKGILYTTTGTGSLLALNLTSAVGTLLGNDNLPTFNGLAAVPIFTDLSAAASASPTVFTKGQNATYTVQVSNNTGDGTAQPITVTTTLPAGLTFVSIGGIGWTASENGQTVTLTYAGGVAANSSVPSVTLTVAVGSSASALVTTSFAVTSTELDANPIPLPATVASVVVG